MQLFYLICTRVYLVKGLSVFTWKHDSI